MQQVVQENLKQAQGKQKRLYDAHSSKRHLEVGNKALVFLPIPGSKLETKWQGPFTVTKALPHVCIMNLTLERHTDSIALITLNCLANGRAEMKWPLL